MIALISPLKPALRVVSLLLPIAVLAADPRPNIILIMADDMGYGDPSYISASTLEVDGTAHPDQAWISTPRMDEMAQAGLRFDRFYSASSVCSPTRASCLTGRNPFRVGIPYANSGFIAEDETPLSELLSAEGYATGHFGKWHLGTLTTLREDSNRGLPGNTDEYHAPWHFDYDVCFATESKVPTYHPYRKTANGAALPLATEIDPIIGYKITDANFYGTHYWTVPADPETALEGVVVPLDEVNNATDGDDSKLITDRAISFIQESVAAGKPFFVVLWYHTPHKPITDPDQVSGLNSSDAAKDSIEDFDFQVGRLRDELDALLVRNSTMLWLTSDNGPEDGVDSPNEVDEQRSVRSGGLRGRKRSFYDGGIRVPGILEWPDVVTSAANTDFLSSTSDYYATILDYLNLSVPTQKALDGISLRPVIEGTQTERSSAIGFRIGDGTYHDAWMTQDYKLVRIDTDKNGSEWELFDMTLPDHELEITPLATESDIATKDQAIQDIYNTMLADYTAWEASVDSDTVYANATTPTAAVSAAITETDEPFPVTITFSKSVEGLIASDFAIAGGYASSVTGSGTSYTALISPDYSSDLIIKLPQGSVFAEDGTPSLPSNELLIDVLNKVEAESSLLGTLAMPNGSYATVDSDDLSAAVGDNNLDKFPTTTLYVRSSANSGQTARRVKALLQFDLSAIPVNSVSSATLQMRGTSLNDTVPVELEAQAAAADWSTTPSYTIATQGSTITAGDVTVGLDESLARDYELDVTEMVNQWLSMNWTNHGIVLGLKEDLNNGVGFEIAGDNAPSLVLNNTSLKLLHSQVVPQDDAPNGILSLVFQTAIAEDYFLLKSTDLSVWENAEERTASEQVTVFDVEIETEPNSKAFYSLSEESAP